MIKAVLFDIGGTLIAEVTKREIYEIYDMILRGHGVNRSRKAIALAHRRMERKYLEDERVVFDNFWVRFNTDFLQDLGVDGNVAELAEAIDREWWSHAKTELCPDVLPVLSALKARGLKLGIITNGLESDIKRIFQKVGFPELFDIKVGADTFQCAKPNPTIFQFTLKKLGVNPSEALFVGDSENADYEGARKAGLKALLVERRQKLGGNNAGKISNLQELFQHL
ncbi:MAG: HAD family hydrolase [Candidatus Bathyarchaeota archaeon]|jgi:putative hydrolase of the HAD superfamily|nr:HAD family hydrolase [Candidatus Bathyarchaeota archaeon]